MTRKVAKSIVNEGKVFHKNFDMIRKIDEFMLTQKSSKGSGKFTFPRLMDQMRKRRRRRDDVYHHTINLFDTVSVSYTHLTLPTIYSV